MSSKSRLYDLVLSAVLLAMALVLPFVTAQIPNIGKMLCPMHLPVLLCAFFCGFRYAAAIGFIAPLLRSLLFGRPAIIPDAVAMCFELLTYGLVAGLLYRLLPKKKISVFAALIAAMLAGRLVWGAVRALIFGLGGSSFGWKAFAAGAFLNSFPGIILQLILVPALVITLNKNPSD